jgi:transposase-like protein
LDFKSTTLIAFLKRNVAPGSTVYTDGFKSFTGLHEAGFKHAPRSQPLRIDLRKGAKSVVPFADRAIGNLQQWLIGTYYAVSRGQLQVYLDELVFRHNRRRLPMAAFQTLLGPGIPRWPMASWIAWCIMLTASRCAASPCAKPNLPVRSVELPDVLSSQKDAGTKGAQMPPPFPRAPKSPARSGCLLDDPDHFRHNHSASVAALRFLIGIAKLLIAFTEKP